MHSAIASTLLLLAALAWGPKHSAADLEICSRSSIYILDLASLATLHGFPSCDLNMIRTDPTNGVVYLKDKGPEPKVDHIFGTHSAPWYLYKAIQNSDCETQDIETADLVYVYDYCYYTWWLAHVHSLGRDQKETPGDYLIRGWSAMIELPRWKRNDGRDFIFYDSHPGFVSGQSAPTFNGMLCNEFRHSTHIIVERAQRNTCQSYLEINKQVISPYVPNVVNTSDPLETFLRPSVPRSKRDIMVFFSGKCIPYRGKNTGKKMRYALVQALKDAGDDTDVQCTENEQGHVHQDFQVMLAKMERSVFCLVVPGDAQSTRRLSEIFMSGCIPVFLGPPYNTMPLAEDVNYQSIGVFFNITAYHSWLPVPMQWYIGSERAEFAQEARWWVPDADVHDQMITVENVGEIMGHLRGMPDSEIDRKLKEMQMERLRFTFQGDPNQEMNAISTISHRIAIHVAADPSILGHRGESKSSSKDFAELASKASSTKGRFSGIHLDNEEDYPMGKHANKMADSGPEARHVADKFKDLDEKAKIEAAEAVTHKKAAKKMPKKPIKIITLDQNDDDDEDEINEKDSSAGKGQGKKTASTQLGHAWLSSNSKSQTNLHAAMAGAIRVGGDTWQPFNLEQTHKPAASKRQTQLE